MVVVVVAVKAACVSVLAPLPWLVLGLGLAECYIIMEFPPPARRSSSSSRVPGPQISPAS